MAGMRKWINLTESENYKTITREEVEQWGSHLGGRLGAGPPYNIDYLHEILIGEYDLNEAREDILSFRKDDN